MGKYSLWRPILLLRDPFGVVDSSTELYEYIAMLFPFVYWECSFPTRFPNVLTPIRYTQGSRAGGKPRNMRLVPGHPKPRAKLTWLKIATEHTPGGACFVEAFLMMTGKRETVRSTLFCRLEYQRPRIKNARTYLRKPPLSSTVRKRRGVTFVSGTVHAGSHFLGVLVLMSPLFWNFDLCIYASWTVRPNGNTRLNKQEKKSIAIIKSSNNVIVFSQESTSRKLTLHLLGPAMQEAGWGKLLHVVTVCGKEAWLNEDIRFIH